MSRRKKRIPAALALKLWSSSLWLHRKLHYRAAKAKAGENAWTVLQSLKSGMATDIHGQTRPTAVFTTDEEGQCLYKLVKEIKPQIALEIGFLHGYSTLHLLQGISENGRGRLISIDPSQLGEYEHGIGLMNVRRAGLEGFHSYWKQSSQLALPALFKNKTAVDFAFVDGSHLLDYTMVEFFYIDKMLPVGGVVAFHDYQNPSVFATLRFIEANYPYTVRPVAAKNLRALTKNAEDPRPWFYFVPFHVPNVPWIHADNRPLVEPEKEELIRPSSRDLSAPV